MSDLNKAIERFIAARNKRSAKPFKWKQTAAKMIAALERAKEKSRKLIAGATSVMAEAQEPGAAKSSTLPVLRATCGSIAVSTRADLR